MTISFESALGLHERALRLRGQRAAVLADNLANIDTPNFKARDLDFKSILRQEVESRMSAAQTNPRHFEIETESGSESQLLYRTPQQASIDGNTVEDQIEHAEYMKNALALQASFEFLNDEFKSLKTAIRGD
ncbi:flagellar basal body rod protein FlgB [Cellvibrio sp.]|uniref:flagellar basal body rod protein FlgB n=1 Tax=Cellvibrio sp. TaxID=1965322 RepID=UPI003964778D